MLLFDLLKMNYDLELNKAVEAVKKSDANSVLIQLPDGLKPKAKEIKEYIDANCDCKVFIWLGSCFGACDCPNVPEVDLLIQWGHSEWN